MIDDQRVASALRRLHKSVVPGGVGGDDWGRPPASLRLSVGLALVTALAFGMSLTTDGGAAEQATAKVVVSDVLTAPLKEAVVKVHLFEPGLLKDRALGGKQLTVSVAKKDMGRKVDLESGTFETVGTAMTGFDGRAFLRFTPRIDGHFALRVEYQADKDKDTAKGTAVFASWERRRPIIFVEAAALMKQQDDPVSVLPGVRLPIATEVLTDPTADAAHQLERLTRFYFYAVYVVRAPGINVQAFRSWLIDHKFPPGLTRVIKPGQEALRALLEEFREEGFENIKGGVGRRRDFADLFASERRATVILSESGKDDAFPRKTKWAADWLEVRKHLQG